MADPYYPKSLLAQSLFSGFYFFFLMYIFIFIIAYPILSLFEPTNLFDLSLHTILETNILWDIFSVMFFFVLSLFFSELILRTPKIPLNPLLGVIASIYFGASIFTVHKYQMYFTDRIFIIVLSWCLCLKTISFIKDYYGKNQENLSLEEGQKNAKKRELSRIKDWQ